MKKPAKKSKKPASKKKAKKAKASSTIDKKVAPKKGKMFGDPIVEVEK